MSIDYDLQNPQMLERWDFLQSRLRCCGAFSYTEYLNVPDVKCVPESCCFNYQEKNSPGCTGFLTKESCKKVKKQTNIRQIGIMKSPWINRLSIWRTGSS